MATLPLSTPLMEVLPNDGSKGNRKGSLAHYTGQVAHACAFAVQRIQSIIQQTKPIQLDVDYLFASTDLREAVAGELPVVDFWTHKLSKNDISDAVRP